MSIIVDVNVDNPTLTVTLLCYFFSGDVPGNTYKKLTDKDGNHLKVGYDRPKHSKNGIEMMKFCNLDFRKVIVPKDPLTMMPMQIKNILWEISLFLLPYPGLENQHIYNSCMKAVYGGAILHGYTITLEDKAKRTHQNNHVTKANQRFADTVVKVLSLYFLQPPQRLVRHF